VGIKDVQYMLSEGKAPAQSAGQMSGDAAPVGKIGVANKSV
jgi:hypothetical protein